MGRSQEATLQVFPRSEEGLEWSRKEEEVEIRTLEISESAYAWRSHWCPVGTRSPGPQQGVRVKTGTVPRGLVV